MRDSKEKIKGEDKMAVKTVDPEVAFLKIKMVTVTFQKKKWRWIWNLKEKNLKMQMPVEMQ